MEKIYKELIEVLSITNDQEEREILKKCLLRIGRENGIIKEEKEEMIFASWKQVICSRIKQSQN